MNSRGKLIAIEGIDGSGKATQTQLLAKALEDRGLTCTRFSFPRYGSFFGRLIGQFLNGEFGALDTVDAHLSAVLYAGDRLEAKAQIEAALAAGHTVLADRYTASNLAHQTARVAEEKRAEFIDWLRQLEYGIYGLPAEDLVIYLHLSTAEAQRLIGSKSARSYTTLDRDLQERDSSHLEQAARVYEILAGAPNWVTVECMDPRTTSPKTPEEIHRLALEAVESRIFPGLLSLPLRC